MHSDSNVIRILGIDGVASIHADSANKTHVSVTELIERYGRTSSWSHTLINSPSNSATLIAQLPGEGNREHFHDDWDEWWYVVEGVWEWQIGDRKVQGTAGDVLFVERGQRHRIFAVGDHMAIRIAVCRYDIHHHFPNEDGR